MSDFFLAGFVVYFREMKAHFMQSSSGAMCTPDIWPASLLYHTNAVFYSNVLMHTLSRQGTYIYVVAPKYYCNKHTTKEL